MIGIIDYDAGNLMSVKKALDYLEIDNFISNDIGKLDKADGYILPGVGAFPSAMQALCEKKLDVFIKNAVTAKPLLGICLGMQLLFDYSTEFYRCPGLGLISGYVDEIPKTDKDNNVYKIPHMGWNSLNIKSSDITNGIRENSYMYFVHSYMAYTQNENIKASTRYSIDIPAIVEKDKVYGAQFHPEKSAGEGLIILENFGKIVRENS